MSVETVDQPPAGWFPLDVMKPGDNSRKWDWVGLLIDVHPDELKHCRCTLARLYVHPDDYKPDGNRAAKEVFVRVPGKHRNKEAAWDALCDIISTPGH